MLSVIVERFLGAMRRLFRRFFFFVGMYCETLVSIDHAVKDKVLFLFINYCNLCAFLIPHTTFCLIDFDGLGCRLSNELRANTRECTLYVLFSWHLLHVAEAAHSPAKRCDIAHNRCLKIMPSSVHHFVDERRCLAEEHLGLSQVVKADERLG